MTLLNFQQQTEPSLNHQLAGFLMTSLMLLRNLYWNSLGSLTSNWLCIANVAWNQTSSFKSSIMEVITGWQSIQLVQIILRCLCMRSSQKWMCSQTATIVEIWNCFCYNTVPRDITCTGTFLWEQDAPSFLEEGCFTIDVLVRQHSRKVTVKAVQYIPVHCTCHMPSIDGIDMIECTACKD